MTCEEIRRQIPLYLYGELSFDIEEMFEQHLDGCEPCRVALERDKALHKAFDAGECPPSADLLERCRLELPRTLRRAADNPEKYGWVHGLRQLLTLPASSSGAWLRPIGAVALVALGFFGARYTMSSPGMGIEVPDSIATRVRYVEPAPDGGVKIVLDETRQRELSGSLEDDQIRQLLLAAVRDPIDPGVRAESVDLLKDRSDTEEVQNALLYTLQNDSNAGVRLKALEALKPYSGDPRSRQVLSRVLLGDENPGIRTMAIDLLVQSAQPDVVETLQDLLQQEDNSYVRLRSQKALREMNASLETF